MSMVEIGAPDAPALAGQKSAPETITALLDAICESVNCDPTEGTEKVLMGDILDRVGRRAYGPLLLIVGLFSISPLSVVPGMTWFAAALTLVLAVQMLLGRPKPWLPQRAMRMPIPRRALVSGVAKARPAAKAIDVLLKPRMAFFTQPPMVNIVALMVIGAALVTFPLGFIPGLPILPGLAVVLFGLGMSARDGLVLILASSLVGLAVWGLTMVPLPSIGWLPAWPF